ncbi:MAG: serine O-acetyltransferase [Caldilineales bacterium]|nr:serine O-acetyltransferase [Caldilineales bacterium]
MLNTLRHDIRSVFARDPAARSVPEVLFCYPGLHALWFYRLAHWCWERRLWFLGRLTSHLGRWLTGIEIHPGAQIGPGLFIDHGMGIVIGETAEIGHDVTLYHGVTLGGVSWRKEKRHPTIGDHVVVGAGAKILGPITVGSYSRIGANSVVVKDVPEHSVVVGVPGRMRLQNGAVARDSEHEDLQHNLLPDATMEQIRVLVDRIDALELAVDSLHGRDEAEAELMVQGYLGPWGI